MTLWTPPQQFSLYDSNLTVPATGAMGTIVTAGTPAHTKNATYTQLIAATTFDCYWIEIHMSEVVVASTDTGTLVDIAIGAAAAEQVIIPNLNAGHAASYTGTTVGGQKYAFPLYIPSGSRISATSQAVTASDTVVVWVKLYGGPKTPVWSGQQVVDYGTSLAASQGVQVTPGASGAEGAWTQIVAATSQNHSFLSAGVAGLDAVIGLQVLLLDIGVGAATEAAIYEHGVFVTSTAEALSQPFPFCVWHPVLSGDRLAARISGSGAAQDCDVILYGVS